MSVLYWEWHRTVVVASEWILNWTPLSEILQVFCWEQRPHRYSTRILGLFLLDYIADVGTPRSENPKLIMRLITFELTQLVWQRYLNVTDGRRGTDGRTSRGALGRSIDSAAGDSPTLAGRTDTHTDTRHATDASQPKWQYPTVSWELGLLTSLLL